MTGYVGVDERKKDPTTTQRLVLDYGFHILTRETLSNQKHPLTMALLTPEATAIIAFPERWPERPTAHSNSHCCRCAATWLRRLFVKSQWDQGATLGSATDGSGRTPWITPGFRGTAREWDLVGLSTPTRPMALQLARGVKPRQLTRMPQEQMGRYHWHW